MSKLKAVDLTYFYFIFYLFSIFLFLEPRVRVKVTRLCYHISVTSDDMVTVTVTSHKTHRKI